MTDREELEEQWLHLYGTRLPEEAADRDWPVRFDHCFGRIIFDCVIGDEWTDHIPSPAYKHLTVDKLQQCVDLAERIIEADDAYLRALNDLSLRYRGKL